MPVEELLGWVILRFGISATAFLIAVLAFRRASRAVNLPAETKNLANRNRLEIKDLAEKIVSFNNRISSAATQEKKRIRKEYEEQYEEVPQQPAIDLNDPRQLKALMAGIPKGPGNGGMRR